jgi:hypothetical protein
MSTAMPVRCSSREMSSAAVDCDKSFAMTVTVTCALRRSSSAIFASCGAFLATNTRVQPSRAKRLMSSYPIPLLAPVISAVFPWPLRELRLVFLLSRERRIC